MLLVDSDESFRGFAGKVLSRGGFRTAVAAGGEEALVLAERLRPRLVVSEVWLADISGYEVCRALRDVFGEAVGILFTSRARTEPADRVVGLMVGADDYLGKPLAGDELLARVRVLARRLAWSHGGGGGGGGGAGGGPGSGGPDPVDRGDLTARELEVLRLLADGMDQETIARTLVISPKTVGKHIEHILGKMTVHSRAEAVAMAYRNGLVKPGEDGPEDR